MPLETQLGTGPGDADAPYDGPHPEAGWAGQGLSEWWVLDNVRQLDGGALHRRANMQWPISIAMAYQNPSGRVESSVAAEPAA